MASHTPLALRRALAKLLPSNTSGSTTQIRHARVISSPVFRPALWRGGRSLQTSSTQDQVLEKYREKLEAKMKAEGVKDYASLREKYKDRIDSLNHDPTIPPLPAELFADTDPIQPPPSPSPHRPQPATTPIPSPRGPNPPPPGLKLLSSYLDTSKLPALDVPSITHIWLARHSSNPNTLTATIPTPTFLVHLRNARAHPMFILPLPRPSGTTEMHFLQWTFPHPQVVAVLFTSLAAYKLHGEFAVPHTTYTHHLELMEDKGLVLALGHVVEDSGVSVQEAKLLVMMLQKFYGARKEGGGEDERRRIELLERFSGGGEGFRIEDVMEEVERI